MRDNLVITNRKGHVVFEGHRLQDEYGLPTYAWSPQVLGSTKGSRDALFSNAARRWQDYPGGVVSGSLADKFVEGITANRDTRYLTKNFGRSIHYAR